MGEITFGGEIADPAPSPRGDSLGVDVEADALDEVRWRGAAGVDAAAYFATSSSILLSPVALPALGTAKAAAGV